MPSLIREFRDREGRFQLQGPSFPLRCWLALFRTPTARPVTSNHWYESQVPAVRQGQGIYIACGEGAFTHTNEFGNLKGAFQRESSLWLVIPRETVHLNAVGATLEEVNKYRGTRARLWVTDHVYRNHFSIVGNSVFFEFPHALDAAPEEKRGIRFENNMEELLDSVERFNEILRDPTTEEIKIPWG